MTATHAEPNLLGFRVNHRAMRGDVRRLAALTSAIAEGRQPYDRGRAQALRIYLDMLCEGIHHHHRMEDEMLWPVLVRSAGAEIDLRELSDDHAALDPLLDQVRDLATRFAGGDLELAVAGQLSRVLAQLRDHLDEHIEEEERMIFPIIRRYVSVADWATVERAVRKGGAFKFEVPRIERYAEPDELAELLRIAGPALRVALRLLRRGFAKREALVFG